MSDQIVIEETGDVLEVLEGTGDALTLLYKALDPATFTAPADNVMPQFDAASDSWQAVALTLAWADITGTPTTLAGYGITDGATDAELAAHTSLTNNPHTVTSAQVGLGSVEDVALSTWAGSANVTTVGTLTSLAVAGALTATGGVDGVLGGVTPAAATVTTLTVSGAGPHAYGSIYPDAFLRLNTAFTGASTNVAGLQFDATLTPPLNGVAWAVVLSPTLVEGASGTHSDFGTLKVRPPTVTPGGATITNLTTLKVTAPPSGGVNNRAFWVVSGWADLGGDVTAGGHVTMSTNNRYLQGVEVGGTTRNLVGINASDVVYFGNSASALSMEGVSILLNASTITAAGKLVGFAANTYDLGSSSLEWANLYLGSTLFFGLSQDVALSSTVANRLDLASGDDFNIVSGDLMLGGTTVLDSSGALTILDGQKITFVDSLGNGWIQSDSNRLVFSFGDVNGAQAYVFQHLASEAPFSQVSAPFSFIRVPAGVNLAPTANAHTWSALNLEPTANGVGNTGDLAILRIAPVITAWGGNEYLIMAGTSVSESLFTVDSTGAGTFAGGIALADGTTFAWSDVSLSRGAANRLDLASGDSFAILDGHLAVGGTTSSNILAFLAGTHPSVEVGLQVQPTLQPDAGGATAIVHVLGSITEAASGTHSFLAGARITAPTVTPGAATVTNAATLYVDGTISATVTGRKEALYVGGTSYFSSTVEIDGAFNHDGSTFGALGATPQAQQAHIVDADGTLADITTKFNTLLANLYEGFGFGAAA